jgi:hypothetical protein
MFFGYTDRGFPYFSSAVRQMAGKKFKSGKTRQIPIVESFSQNDYPPLPQVAEAFGQSYPNPSGFSPQKFNQPKLFPQEAGCLIGDGTFL